jgi:hypothetical protein
MAICGYCPPLDNSDGWRMGSLGPIEHEKVICYTQLKLRDNKGDPIHGGIEDEHGGKSTAGSKFKLRRD